MSGFFYYTAAFPTHSLPFQQIRKNGTCGSTSQKAATLLEMKSHAIPQSVSSLLLIFVNGTI